MGDTIEPPSKPAIFNHACPETLRCSRSNSESKSPREVWARRAEGRGVSGQQVGCGTPAHFPAELSAPTSAGVPHTVPHPRFPSKDADSAAPTAELRTEPPYFSPCTSEDERAAGSKERSTGASSAVPHDTAGWHPPFADTRASQSEVLATPVLGVSLGLGEALVVRLPLEAVELLLQPFDYCPPPLTLLFSGA